MSQNSNTAPITYPTDTFPIGTDEGGEYPKVQQSRISGFYPIMYYNGENVRSSAARLTSGRFKYGPNTRFELHPMNVDLADSIVEKNASDDNRGWQLKSNTYLTFTSPITINYDISWMTPRTGDDYYITDNFANEMTNIC